jgi:hypothetical protein
MKLRFSVPIRFLPLWISIWWGFFLAIALWAVSCGMHPLPAQAAAHAAAGYGSNGGLSLPDAKATPGAVDPEAIADLSGKQHLVAGIERNLCAQDFRTGPIRSRIRNFAKLKREACAEYGVTRCDASVEGDHLISIEIGGCPDCLANIWPQPIDQARIKDHQVEDVLPRLVCAGKMSLDEARKCIAGDWVACAARLSGEK